MCVLAHICCQMQGPNPKTWENRPNPVMTRYVENAPGPRPHRGGLALVLEHEQVLG
jgi:hypothetical protein